MIVSVLFTIAKSSAKQDVITSPDSDVIQRSCLPIPFSGSRAVGLHWSQLPELNSDV